VQGVGLVTAFIAGLALTLAAALAQSVAPAQPAVVDVFVGGTNGHSVYRIPAIVRLDGGRLLAFAEARGSQSDNGANDLVMRASEDGGATWSAMRTVLDLPGRSLNNPCVVQLSSGPRTGRVLLMFQSYPTGKGEGEVTPGNDGDDTCRTLLMHSDDRGATWSAPRDVSSAVKRPAPVTSVATGPGIGIELRAGEHRGRVVMPFNEGPQGKWRVYCALSDDGGDTWSMGDVAPDGGGGRANEVQVAERADGSLLLVARQFWGGARRKAAESRDGGRTWSTLRAVPELVDPSCMGGLIAVDAPAGRLLVCTGPASEKSRVDGTAWISADGGATWPRTAPVFAGSFAYSVPVPLGGTRVGVLFERDGCSRIAFTVIDVGGAARAGERDASAPR
jgi:sialidase-1